MSLYIGGQKIAGHGGVSVVSCTMAQYDAFVEAGSLNPNTIYVTYDDGVIGGQARLDAISAAFMYEYHSKRLSVDDLSAGVTMFKALRDVQDVDPDFTVVVTDSNGMSYNVPAGSFSTSEAAESQISAISKEVVRQQISGEEEVSSFIAGLAQNELQISSRQLETVINETSGFIANNLLSACVKNMGGVSAVLSVEMSDWRDSVSADALDGVLYVIPEAVS